MLFRYRPALWNIDNLLKVLSTLSSIKNLHLLGPIIHLQPGNRTPTNMNTKILELGLKIIQGKFPMETQFRLIDQVSCHEIRKVKMEKPILNGYTDPDLM